MGNTHFGRVNLTNRLDDFVLIRSMSFLIMILLNSFSFFVLTLINSLLNPTVLIYKIIDLTFTNSEKINQN